MENADRLLLSSLSLQPKLNTAAGPLRTAVVVHWISVGANSGCFLCRHNFLPLAQNFFRVWFNQPKHWKRSRVHMSRCSWTFCMNVIWTSFLHHVKPWKKHNLLSLQRGGDFFPCTLMSSNFLCTATLSHHSVTDPVVGNKQIYTNTINKEKMLKKRVRNKTRWKSSSCSGKGGAEHWQVEQHSRSGLIMSRYWFNDYDAGGTGRPIAQEFGMWLNSDGWDLLI